MKMDKRAEHFVLLFLYAEKQEFLKHFLQFSFGGCGQNLLYDSIMSEKCIFEERIHFALWAKIV